MFTVWYTNQPTVGLKDKLQYSDIMPGIKWEAVLGQTDNFHCKLVGSH